MMREDSILWYELLDQLISYEGLSRAQVARRADVKTKTITSWVRGDVQSPRHWQPLVRVLKAINANATNANVVLKGADHLPIYRLAAHASGKDYQLLAAWLEPEVPFLPPDRLVTTIIGRMPELEQAITILQQQKRCVLLGMGGVGKTTLAIELAHQLKHDYPDGVFWGDMRIAKADAVLESWGQACGLAIEKLSDFSSRATRLRDFLAKKQALLILDDVIDGQQAHQIIPAQGKSAVLMTTRSEDAANSFTNRQSHLIIKLNPMSRQHSLMLLDSIAGADALAEANASANRIADLLGDLPLALHICAALCADTEVSLDDMAILLDELRTRLDYLQLEDKPLVRLAFEQSWLLLDEQMRCGLATLAVFGGRPFNILAFAASTGLSKPESILLLTRLCRRSLLTVIKKARTGELRQYQQHSLLASYVSGKLSDNDPAWPRFSQYFARLIDDANWWRVESIETWGNVMAGMEVAYKQQWWSLVLTYATCLTEAWRRKGFYHLARQGYRWALHATQEMANQQTEADIYLAWGHACLDQSDDTPAREYLTCALTLFKKQQRMNGLADTYYHLSRVEMGQGGYDEAETAVQEAYRAYQTEENVQGMARALYRLSDIVYHRGSYQRAVTLVEDAICTQQQVDDKLGLLRSHMLATFSLIQLERIDEAASHCQKAAQLVEKLDDEAERASFYYTYADVLRNQKKFSMAQTQAQMALTMFRKMGDIRSEIHALIMLAGNSIWWYETDPQPHHIDSGLTSCLAGLEQCATIDYTLGKGYLLLMNGRLLVQQGQHTYACTCFKQALALARDLDHEWLQNRLKTLMDEIHCVPDPRSPKHLLDESLAP